MKEDDSTTAGPPDDGAEDCWSNEANQMSGGKAEASGTAVSLFPLDELFSEPSRSATILTGRWDDDSSQFQEAISSVQGIQARKNQVLRYLEEAASVADLKLSLYMIASENPAYLWPFPVSLVPHNETGLALLNQLNDDVPSVKLLKVYLKNGQCAVQVINLVHWILLHNTEIRLKEIPPKLFQFIFSKVRNAINFEQPTYVFKFFYSKFSKSECKWQAIKENKKTSFCFYNASLQSVHSIINVGFLLLLKEDSVSFSTDLRGCLMKSTDDGWCWGKSSLGVRLKMVMVVEILDDDKVERRPAANALLGVHGDSELIQVKKLELVRIRYLLLFVEKDPFREKKMVLCSKSCAGRPAETKRVLTVLGSVVVLGVIYSFYLRKPIVHTGGFMAR